MPAKERVDVNFFKPSTPGMKAEAGIAKRCLLGWGALSFGIPLLIFIAGTWDPSGLGESFMTRWRIFGFPLHYWLVAQGCTIGYILLCKLYCILWKKGLGTGSASVSPLKREER